MRKDNVIFLVRTPSEIPDNRLLRVNDLEGWDGTSNGRGKIEILYQLI